MSPDLQILVIVAAIVAVAALQVFYGTLASMGVVTTAIIVLAVLAGGMVVRQVIHDRRWTPTAPRRVT